VHGAPGENLFPRLRELAVPLRTAGPVRGEDYDERRFKLRQLCCSGCGALVDVQVALDGAPRPRMRMALS
jgi:N-methylhydantoinase B